jgi:molybdopterin/thiamine biosynthesis adenylyltransferase
VSGRYLRQELLAEVGAAGQRRIESATARVAGAGLAHEVAALYAERAGFAAVTPGEIDVDVLAPAAILRSPPARQVLAGARAALHAMRRALAEGSP